MTLPPKRFEHPADPKFDPIRHKPWFSRLEKRREKLHLLRSAYWDMNNNNSLQKDAAKNFGVDERELRDYTKFLRLQHTIKPPQFQDALDLAYDWYCDLGAKFNFGMLLAQAALQYKIKPRALQEMWEIDPTFWPKKASGKILCQ